MTEIIKGVEAEPEDYKTPTKFKRAVYREGGAGSWFQDMKLTVIWYLANDKREEIPEHLEPLISGGAE